MPSLVTSITIGGKALQPGGTIGQNMAGKPIGLIGGEGVNAGPAYLYGPGRDKPNTAILPTLAMPNPLPAGKYTGKFQRRGDGGTSYYVVNFTVAESVDSDSDASGNDSLPMGWGIAGNENDGKLALLAAMAKVKADGGRWLRLWHSGFYNLSDTLTNIIKGARFTGDGKLADCNVILCVQPKDGDAKNLGTPDFAAWVNANAEALKLCAYVEVGNELNLVKYRPDDLGGNWYGPYVQRWLAPLSKELRKIGVKVMLTSTTDRVQVSKYQSHAEGLKAAGAIPYIDAVATHLYATPADFENVAPVLQMLATTYGKPVVVTEAAPNKLAVPVKDFPARFAEYAAELKQGGASAACFYRGLRHPNAKEWPAELSLFDSSINPTASYVAVLSAVKA
jgi:hypothetical protein